ncbi:MAG: hypothetical protein HKM24_00710 [Gammaproteobacteria bacterium]|nr:hypothetical protein [Gammaproteobacteria bacterium]
MAFYKNRTRGEKIRLWLMVVLGIAAIIVERIAMRLENLSGNERAWIDGVVLSCVGVMLILLVWDLISMRCTKKLEK